VHGVLLSRYKKAQLELEQAGHLAAEELSKHPWLGRSSPEEAKQAIKKLADDIRGVAMGG